MINGVKEKLAAERVKAELWARTPDEKMQ
jgi:hypothetical protein